MTGGSHFTYTIDENVICMVVSGPDANISAKTEEGRYSLYLFTEIDHNYVNPVSYEYIDKVNSAFADIDKWNNQEAYRTPYDTFNEYMTWAVFTLYAYERYTEVEFNSIKEIAINIMENRRFVKFSDFNSKLLDLYKAGNGTKVESLFPEILTWSESQ